MFLEVRCCCDPGKLLGFLQVPLRPADVRVGVAVTFQVPGYCVRLGDDAVDVPPGRVTLPIEWLGTAPFVGHLALKSEDTPIWRLQQIPGWVDALPERV